MPRLTDTNDLDILVIPEAAPSSVVMVDVASLGIIVDPLLGASLPRSDGSGEARVEIVFIESDVRQLDTLLAGIDPGKEVHVLDASQDGLQQILTILNGRSGIDALHIISHGREGEVSLGSVLLNSGMASDHAAELQTIGSSLAPGADVLLYGCDVASGEQGQLFINELATITGADVAASSTLTGSASLNGDWVLEVQVGSVETAAVVDDILAQHYSNVLSLTNATVNFGTGGNFVSTGGYYAATDNVVYKVNNNTNYQLKIDAATHGVAGSGGNAYLANATLAYGGDAKIIVSFVAGNVFTATSVFLRDQQGGGNPGAGTQNLVFTGKDSGGSVVATQNLSLNPDTTSTLVFSGFTNVASIEITATSHSSKVVALTLDDFVFNTIQSVDSTPPTVSSVNSSTANASYKVGDTVSVQVNFSEAVTVTGTPQLTLETGTTDRVVNYASGSGTSTLTFTYTVQAGDTSADLDYQSTTALALNSGTIKDAAGNAGTLTLAAPGAANSLGNNKAIVIDGVVPTVTSVNSSTANAAYKVGDTLSVQVNFSEAVTVTGTPQLTLETGTTDQVVNYASGSGTSTLTFTYTVQAGDTSSDLDYQSTTALALNSGTIKDAAGNAATLTLAAPGAANSLGNNKAIVIDGVVPTVTSVSSSTANGSYKTGDTVSVQVNFSEAVTVTGIPQLTLETGTTDQVVNYASGSGTSTLTFTYTVQAGDTTADLDYQNTSALALNSGTIKDAAGNAGTLTLASPGAANSLGANKAIVIDGLPPTVTSVTSSTANGSYNEGDTISVQVNFSEAVTVTGTPQLTLETGTTDQIVNYASGSGTSTLTFSYTVQAGDTSADLDYQSTTALVLNSGTIKDAAGNAGTLTLAAPGAANSLGSNKAIVVDTASPVAPGAPAMTSGTDSGVSDSDDITNDTTPTLTGTAEANATVKLYDTDGTTLLGTVSADGSGNWSITSTTLAAGSHTLTAKATDSAGNTGSASAGLSITIDTTAPTTTIVTSSFSADTGVSSTDFITSTAAQTLSGTLSANMVSGELAEISIDNGSTWTTATTTVGQNTFSLSGVTLASSDTLQVRVSDIAGNTGTTLSQAYVLDTTGPTSTIASVAFSADTGVSSTDFITKTAAQTISGTLSANIVSGEIVEVSIDNGSTWTTATTTVGLNTFSLSGITLTGSNTLKVRVSDTAGNSGTAASQAYVLDTTAPATTIATTAFSADTGISSTDFITKTSAQTISGTLSANIVSGELVEVSIDNGSTWATATSTVGQNTFSLGGVTLAASDTLKVRVSDFAGNAGTTASQAYVLDTTAPNAPSTPDMTSGSDSGGSTSDNITSTTAPTFSGTSAVGTVVKLYDTDGTTELGSATTDGSGNWSITSATLTAGAHTLTAKATDAAGNAGSASAGLAVTVDATSPSVAITSNVAAVKTGETATLTFTFSETPVGFTSGDITATAGAISGFAVSGDPKVYTATFTPTASLQATNASVTIATTGLFTDDAGNIGGIGTTPALAVDTLAPTLNAAGSTPADDATSFPLSDNIIIKFSEALSGASVLGSVELREVVAGTLVPSAVSIDGSGNLVINPAAALSEGTAYYASWAAGVLKDLAGNTHAGILTTDKTTFNFTAGAPVVGPPPTGDITIVDGVSVVTTSSTDASGTQTSVMTIAPFTGNRTEDGTTSNPTLADIPLAKDANGNVLLNVGLPNNVGMTVETITQSTLTLRQQVISKIQSHLADPGNLTDIINNGIDQFAKGVASDPQITFRTITLIAATSSVGTIVINGALGAGEDNGQFPNRYEALVLDTRSLPAGTVVQLDNIDFAVVIGAARVVGGEGRNFIVGDGASQFLLQGSQDDILHGGDGNDTVASKAGADQLFGEAGNDLLVGGADNDILDGGADNDVLQGGQSDAGSWSIHINAAGQAVASFVAREPVLTTLASQSIVGSGSINVSNIDDRIGFLSQTADRLKTVSLLVEAALDRLPTLAELNYFSTLKVSDAELARLAFNYILATHTELVGTNLKAKVAAFVGLIWDVNVPDDAYVTALTDRLNGGANGMDEFLATVRDAKNTHLAPDASGNLQLAQLYVMNESGWLQGNDSDVLRGGDGNDRLVGGHGNDTLHGGNGIDLAAFSGNVNDYLVRKTVVDDVIQILLSAQSTGETDTMTGVEYLQIGSRYFDLQSALPLISAGEATAFTSVAIEVVGSQLQAQGVTLLV